MPTPSDLPAAGSVTVFFSKLRLGDAAAAQGLWDRFFPRLVALACATLKGLPQRVADGDDAVQSAFASFCQRVRFGEFDVQDRNDLWNLLGVMTKRKALHQIRRERAAKRGGGRTIGEGALVQLDGSPLPLDELGSDPSAAEFDLRGEELLGQLRPELREVALLRLLGYCNAEIADHLQWTERKVERKLNLIRLRWEAEWPGGAGG